MDVTFPLIVFVALACGADCDWAEMERAQVVAPANSSIPARDAEIRNFCMASSSLGWAGRFPSTSFRGFLLSGAGWSAEGVRLTASVLKLCPLHFEVRCKDADAMPNQP